MTWREFYSTALGALVGTLIGRALYDLALSPDFWRGVAFALWPSR